MAGLMGIQSRNGDNQTDKKKLDTNTNLPMTAKSSFDSLCSEKPNINEG